MKKLYRIPEIGIWLLFSVLICSGYAFSFLSYAARHTQVSVFHVVLSVVICLLLAGGGVIYTKMSHHRQWLLDFSKAEWIILEGSILLLFFAGGYIFRFTDCFANIWQDGLEDTFFQYAQVVSDRVTYANPHLISRIYVGILHIACRFFGNIYEAGAALQFILQLLSTFVWYMALRKLYGRVTALLFAFGAMLLPDSIRHSVQCDPTMLLFLIYGCTVFGMAYYMKSYMPAKWRMLMEVLLGMLTAVCVLADISGMLILFGFVCTLIRKHKLLSGSFWSKWLPAMTGLFAGMLFVIVLQAGLYGICLMDSLSLQSYHGLKPVFPKSTFWYYYMERLGRHQIFFPAVFVILAYWFIRNRKRLTYIMGGGLIFVWYPALTA